MTVKLEKIILAIPALSKLRAGDLSLSLAYQLKKNIFALQKEADFFSEQRQKILEKYGKEQENGSYFVEDTAAANSELESLLEMDVSPDIEILDVAISEDLKLSVNDIDALAPFIRFVELEGF